MGDNMIKYRKHTAIILLVMICLTLTMPLVAYADDGRDTQATQNSKDKGNMFEKAVAGLLDFFNRTLISIWDAAGFKSLSELVFAAGLSDTEKDALPWQPSQTKYIYKFYMGLMLAVIPVYILLIAVSAFKFLSAAINPKERAEAKDSVMRLFYGLLIMLLAPYLVEILMQTSLFITDAISYAFRGIGNVQDLNSLSVDILNSDNISTGSVLGTVLVKIMFGMLFLYFNIIYIIRMVAISVMLVFTPIMSMAWVINKNTVAVAVWLGELASNAFMPVAHALVLCVILMLTDVKNVSDGSFITILIMLYVLVPLAETVRNSLQSIVARMAGFDGDGAAKSVLGGVTGVASLMRVGKATMGSSSAAISKGVTKTGGQAVASGALGITAGAKMPTPDRKPVSPKSNYQSRTLKTFNTPASANTTQATQYQAVKQQSFQVKKADGTTTQGTAKIYNTPTRTAMSNNTAVATKTPTIRTATKAGAIAGTAVKLAALPALAVAGAVPGMQPLMQPAIKAGANLASAGANKTATAVVAGGQIAKAYSQTRNMGQALQKVTGTTDKKQAMTRIMSPQQATKYQVSKQYAQPNRMITNAHNNKGSNRYQVKELRAVNKQNKFNTPNNPKPQQPTQSKQIPKQPQYNNTNAYNKLS